MRVLSSSTSPKLIDGTVDRGFGRGSRLLGFPTANLNSNKSASLSEFLSCRECKDGIYIGWASVSCIDEPQKAAISVGLNPTFEDSEVRLLEAHLIDYSGTDFYGQDIRIVLCAYIREALKFSSLDELKCEIWKDCEFARHKLEKEAHLAELKNHPFLKFGS